MIEIYTDGACKGNPGNGGYAFSIMLENNTVVNRSYGVLSTTNNRMELNAVISALRYLLEQGYSANTKCTVYTDSAYVANAFNKGWLDKWVMNGFKGIKNIDLWKNVLELTLYFEVGFVLVPGHKGIIGNEIVDGLAQRACNKQGLIESSINEIIENEKRID